MMIRRSITILRPLGIATLVLLIVGCLVWLDLANRGQVWQALWSITGEETSVGQMRGWVEWMGNVLRPSLRTEPMVAIDHVGDNPYGINTFLEQEVEIWKRDRQVEMIAAAGFGWIRQEFPWQDIEIHGRGDFEDRRNDLNQDGTIDPISAWEKYDHIVDVVEAYGLRLQVRLSNPPSWTHADPAIGEKAPSDDLQDFVNYAAAVAERYRGRILHYQVWNEPNIYPEWGEQPVNPEAYSEMLCRTYDALKAVDPNIVVISAALAPTVNLSERNLSDFVFLQRMYDAGAGQCFDVMSTQGYGFYSGPTDQRMRPTTLTFSHHVYVRDIMVANGDAHKPIWLAEAAWNAQPEDPSLVTVQYGNFGIVNHMQAAEYMPQAYERAQREWPWLGVINYWFFKHADDSRRDQSWYYFRMVEPDFTPLPIYDAMRMHIGAAIPTLYAGTHQAETHGVRLSTDAAVVPVEGGVFGQAAQAAEMAFIAYGSQIRLRWQCSGVMRVNGQTPDVSPDSTEWYETTIAASDRAQLHTIEIDGNDDGLPCYFDTITVIDRTRERLTLMIAAVGIVTGMFLYAVMAGLRARGTH